MNRLLNTLKSTHVMARANFDSWMHSPRTILMLLFVVGLCYVVCGSHIRMLRATTYEVHWDETLFFILSRGSNITMTSILFLVTVSELPRRMGYQYNMLIRSTRNQWLYSQIFYCLWMTLCMIVLVSVCAAIFIIPGVVPGSGWTDDLRIAQGIISPDQALVPAFIRENYTPLAAYLLALVPMFLFWIAMVFVVLLCSLLGAPILGVLVYALMLVANVVFMVEALGNFPMPMYYSTLINITAGWPGMEFTKISEALSGYGIAIMALVACMTLRIKWSDLEFNAEQRM